MPNSLLPPNATPLERGLEAAVARVGEVAFADAAKLWDPATCPLALLPWLAWSVSVDGWDAGWSEAMKREAVAGAIELHRLKGTRASVETVLARLDKLLTLVEWFEPTPKLDPHTFEIHLPIAADDVVPGGARSTAAFAEKVIDRVNRVKPLREHFKLVQQLDLVGGIGIQAVARMVGAVRATMAFTDDTSRPWAALLQDDNGEPLQDDTFDYLDTTP